MYEYANHFSSIALSQYESETHLNNNNNQTKAKNADRQFKNLGLYSLSKIQNKSFNLNIINKNT